MDYPGYHSVPMPELSRKVVAWRFMVPHEFGTLGDVHFTINRKVKYALEAKDHWQTPDVTMEWKAGDCEDYAVAKYAALRDLGYEAEDLAVLVGYVIRYRRFGRLLARREAHAVLMINHEGQTLVSDNRYIRVKPLAFYLPLFQPLYWCNEDGGGVYMANHG